MSDKEFLIQVSYMEIYNKEINDFLAVENQKLPIHEILELWVDLVRSTIGIEDGDATMPSELFGSSWVDRGLDRSCVSMNLTGRCPGGSLTRRGSITNLVDLAGFEQIAKAEAGGVQLKEGKYINKSLIALGNVINKLSDCAKQRYLFLKQ
ncbi:hypothetical protein Ddye_003973 [Dipteronia dyeriana]|uniref:Kinesin motor domain-containing protein n=1 Tax=Dipteronia dyeriana TaxID=168575 RepID=A0AAD9XTA2_9ROSI|nr:hypothetical protein Ddye_003973 [Dipteronia dyeriana]